MGLFLSSEPPKWHFFHRDDDDYPLELPGVRVCVKVEKVFLHSPVEMFFLWQALPTSAHGKGSGRASVLPGEPVFEFNNSSKQYPIEAGILNHHLEAVDRTSSSGLVCIVQRAATGGSEVGSGILKFRGPNCTVPILGTSSSTRRIF